VRTLGLVTSLLAIGCSSKPTPQPAAGSGSGSATPSDAAVANAAQRIPASEPIELPKLSGKPPAKTSKPHSKAEQEALASLEFKGFVRDLRRLEPLEVRQHITQRPRIDVQVNVIPCKPCVPMQLDKWQASTLKSLLPTPLRNQPDLQFEVGETELGGAKLIYTYELGQYAGPDETGEQRRQYTDAYVLYFNDGVNQLRVTSKYVDDALPSKEHMARVVPREDLEKMGKALFDSYAQAWGN